MKKILSIDFDIIMYPCIEIYNQRVPTFSWNDLKTNPLFGLVYGDLELYTKLTKFLLEQTKKLEANNFHFIESHESIVNYLPKNQEFELTNIDHHHDIAYCEKDGQTKITSNLGCGNWVKYCFDNNYPITKYTWIHSDCSNFPIEQDKHFLTDTRPIFSFNPYFGDYDEIIICLSKPWVPPNYQELFYNWINILENIYNTSFSIN